MSLIWATRGRNWGFQFLLDGGFDDPLPIYDEVFAGAAGEQEHFSRVGNSVAVRFSDPLERQDASGRVIPHDFVIFAPIADEISSVEDGRNVVWPIVRGRFSRVWRKPHPPARP